MKRAIEFRVLMQVEVPDDMTDEQAHFYLEENHCMTNHVDRLAEAVRVDDRSSVCNLCPFASVVLLGRDAPLDEFFDPERTPDGAVRCGGVLGEVEVRALVAEVRRLRGLIKRVERASDCEVGSEPNGGCPWCGNAGPHVGCPAFTPDGAVR